MKEFALDVHSVAQRIWKIGTNFSLKRGGGFRCAPLSLNTCFLLCQKKTFAYNKLQSRVLSYAHESLPSASALSRKMSTTKHVFVYLLFLAHFSLYCLVSNSNSTPFCSVGVFQHFIYLKAKTSHCDRMIPKNHIYYVFDTPN